MAPQALPQRSPEQVQQQAGHQQGPTSQVAGLQGFVKHQPPRGQAHERHQQQERAAAARLASLAPRRPATHTPCDDGTGHLDMDGTLAPLGLLIVLCCGSLTAAGLWHLAALLLG